MSGLAIHQLVHGYGHGHSLLASSTDLDRSDLDLVGRLSDLSGALGPDLEISPYLSMYPLPSQKFFAVAQTLPDQSASRSGCVLTHTILVPLETWATDEAPNRFAALLRTPTRDALAEYTVAITSIPTAPPKATAVEPLGASFIQQYFGEGLAPIAWFGAIHPEAAAWCVIHALWPSLRAHFACCTFALQPRTLGDRPFDLVFAPTAVFSRFGEFARDHIVDGRAMPNLGASESWFRSWSHCVFEGNGTEICERVHALCSDLEPHPTAIRRVLFFLELKDRARESPTAALGALDLLETLAPKPFEAQRERCALAVAAMRSVTDLVPLEALELVYLLCRRLQGHPFTPGQDLQVEIRSAIHRLIENNPEQGIKEADSLISRHEDAAPKLFMLGIGDALMALLASGSVAPSLVVEHQTLTERLIGDRPELAGAILRSSGQVDRKRIISSLVESCRAEQASGVRPALRSSLLSEIAKSADAPLLEELLRDLGSEEVSQVCDLVESRGESWSGALIAVVGRLVGERQPFSVRQWAQTHSWSTHEAATIIAASYPTTADGLKEFFNTELLHAPNQPLLLAAFIERASAFSPPAWLLSHFQSDLRSWELLLQGINDGVVSDAIATLVRRGLGRSPIARVRNAARLIAGAKGKDSNVVKEYVIRQLLADYLDLVCDTGTVKLWFEESWVAEALTHIRADSIRAMLAEQLKRSPSCWALVWNLIENFPNTVAFNNERLVHEIISALLQSHSGQWTVAAANSWEHLLARISSGDRVRVNLCAQALHFALEHRRLPLASVVAETFYPVHEAAMDDQPNRGPWFLWRFSSWDKAKDLRRSLVDAFLQSDWPPPYFVLSAREPWLLRKLCNRMLRQWKGHEFLESAYAGLKKLASPQNSELASVLKQIIRNPEAVEEWD